MENTTNRLRIDQFWKTSNDGFGNETSTKVKRIEVYEFLKLAEQNPVIDVRSPAEFEYGRIPGAINIPLFENEERAVIGTLYKQKGKELAIKRGLEIVGPKMRRMVEAAEALRYQEGLLVHCWRGGMRSGSVAWLFQTYGLPVFTLNGGYKSFRAHVLEQFEIPLRLMIITGPTGSGKTELLGALKESGEQVIDLEGLAHHKGSVFGELGQVAQPSSEHFQNELFWELRNLDLAKTIWLEDESIGIGKVMIPEPFWRQMGKSPRVHFRMDRHVRISRLVREYGSFPSEVLEAKINLLEKRLGGQHAKEAVIALRDGNVAAVADKLLVYYDKAYSNALLHHQNDLVTEVNADHENFAHWAGLIKEKTKLRYV